MNKADTTYITLGKIGSAYGVKGWFKIHVYTESEHSILDYDTWYLSSGQNEWKAVQKEEGRPHGNIVVAKLANINTPEEARLLTGKLIAIKRAELPALQKDEYYWSDLVGMTVINTQQQNLGKVIYIMETGSNDVLVVKNDKEHGIPYLPGKVVLNVDLERKEILVDWEII